jgi:hypothetical protein
MRAHAVPRSEDVIDTSDDARKGGTATAPTYHDRGTKGLIRRDYLNGDAGTGGVYL